MNEDLKILIQIALGLIAGIGMFVAVMKWMLDKYEKNNEDLKKLQAQRLQGSLEELNTKIQQFREFLSDNIDRIESRVKMMEGNVNSVDKILSTIQGEMKALPMIRESILETIHKIHDASLKSHIEVVHQIDKIKTEIIRINEDLIFVRTKKRL